MPAYNSIHATNVDAPSAHDSRVCILLVEDDDGDAGLVTWALSRQSEFSFTLDRRDTLDRAIEACRTNTYSVIILDLHLPGAEPLGTISAMAGASPESAIVILSGLNDKSIAEQSVLAGADDYLVKQSVNQNAICRSIRHSLERRQCKNIQLRLREEFLSHVSHELRTPLAAALGAAEMFQDGDCGDLTAAGARFLGILTSNLRLLETMIGDLVDTTMVRSGKLSIAVRPARVDSLVSRVVSAMSPLADSAGINLQMDIQAFGSVLADAERITQVLTNLVSNAIKYTPAGGSVIVTATVVRMTHVQITVRDSGIGIPATSLPSLFDRLYQVPQDAIATSRRGLGLGLFISKEIVEAHGGTLTAASEAGMGTEMTVSLPLDPSSLSPEHTDCGGGSESVGGQSDPPPASIESFGGKTTIENQNCSRESTIAANPSRSTGLDT